MKTGTILPLVAAIVLFGADLLAGDIKVIANRSVGADSITAMEIREVFLRDRKSLADGSRVEPVFAKHGTAHEIFLKRYLGKSDDALRNYYRTMVFTGTGSMPKVLASDYDIVNYVAKTTGAVGYVDADTTVEGVKVLTIMESGTRGDRTLVSRVEPDYPTTLKSRGIRGTVRLQLTVSPKGSVESVAVLGGNPILAESAVRAVKEWVYSVAPSSTMIEVSVPFGTNR